jgi:acetylornithine deacetylase/succinyl-diaminopimelate desuccinylase-like protein
VPTLLEYITVPSLSPAFDPQWASNGHMDRALDLLADWSQLRLTDVPGAAVEVVRLPQRTPLLLAEVPGDSASTVLIYGHLDKQPEMEG